MRRLLLLSHDFSESKYHSEKLQSKAKRQAQKMGAWVQQNGIYPDVVVCSPEESALLSAEKAIKAGGGNALGIVVDQRLESAELHEQLAVLSEHTTAQQILCVASHHAMSRVLKHLCSDAPILDRGNLALLNIKKQGLHSNTAHLEALVSSRDLPSGFPYPDPTSPERRDRPAYYYTQSAALPYRLHQGALEVILITSSGGQKWIIPKGICEPGLTPEASAAKEALEEAGVRGNIEAHSIGRYELAKWGATCSIDVYPMAVTELLGEGEWHETHRQREWLDPQSAAARITQPELAQIVRNFTASE